MCASRNPHPKASPHPSIEFTNSANKGLPMDSNTIIAVASIATAGLTTGIGTMCPALGEGRAVATALTSLAQQPDASATITRTLFVGLAMIIAPLIMLPKRRTARASVRESSLIRLNGSMMTVGCT